MIINNGHNTYRLILFLGLTFSINSTLSAVKYTVIYNMKNTPDVTSLKLSGFKLYMTCTQIKKIIHQRKMSVYRYKTLKLYSTDKKFKAYQCPVQIYEKLFKNGKERNDSPNAFNFQYVTTPKGIIAWSIEYRLPHKRLYTIYPNIKDKLEKYLADKYGKPTASIILHGKQGFIYKYHTQYFYYYSPKKYLSPNRRWNFLLGKGPHMAIVETPSRNYSFTIRDWLFKKKYDKAEQRRITRSEDPYDFEYE